MQDDELSTADSVGELLDAALRALAEDPGASIALLGSTPTALSLLARLHQAVADEQILGIFESRLPDGGGVLRPWIELAASRPDVLIVCSDGGKERLLRSAADAFSDVHRLPQTIIAGIGHLGLADPLYAELDAPALVPSYATGHPNTRVHLFDCLRAAAANGLDGAIVEFGSFKGGTTAWLARTARRLGLKGQVIGFDSWSGFPNRRSLLDLYAHERCVFSDVDSVRAHLGPEGVELVVGDISETAGQRLQSEPVLLAFVDTDNYSPAVAALKAVLPNLIAGGAIVLDHYFTTEEYAYTVGERMAATEVLSESGLLHLHGTGVFVRLFPTTSNGRD